MATKKTKRRIKLSPKLPTRKAVQTSPREILQVGRNQPCPCGSDKKYKDCHITAGERFLAKVARQRRMESLKEERQGQKEHGIPWYKRLFTKV